MTIDTNSLEFQKAVAAEVAKQVAEEVSKLKGVEKIGFKQTMNIDDVKDYHKLLKKDLDDEEISKMLLIDESTLKKFSPKIVKEKKAAKQAALNAMIAKHATVPASASNDSTPQPNLMPREQAKQNKAKAKA